MPPAHCQKPAITQEEMGELEKLAESEGLEPATVVLDKCAENSPLNHHLKGNENYDSRAYKESQ